MEQTFPSPPGIKKDEYIRIIDLVLPFVRKIWIERKKIVLINAAVLLVTVVYNTFFVKPFFESTITILPDYGSKSSNLGLLASFAGISLGEGTSTNDIYQNLLASESVLDVVINSKYKSEKYADSVTLIKYFGIRPDEEVPEESRERKIFIDACNAARGILTISADKNTRIMTLTVRMPEPLLSATIANKFVESLDDYIRTKRKSNSLLQRSYIEKRVAEVSDSLQIVENELERFQLANRGGGQSPSIIMAQTRLTRQIQILQGVYIELSRQLEIAKIDIIRDAPVINVKEFAQDPVVKSGPNVRNRVIMIFVFSVFMTMMYFMFFDTAKMLYKKILNVLNDQQAPKSIF